ncbi:hypothetical protein ACV22Z_31395, partial [Burkholderia sp. PU8-34]
FGRSARVDHHASKFDGLCRWLSKGRATLAARGLGRSGAMDVWEQALETDRATVEQIAASKGVHIQDLAEYIDKRRAAAVKECQQLCS